ncbi:MAG: ATP-binding protein [Bradymonadaceae bacterium]
MTKRTFTALVLGEVSEIDDEFRSKLSREQYRVEIRRADDFPGFREAVNDPHVDLVITDVVPHGLDVVDVVMEKSPMRQVIILGDPDHTDVILQAKRRGLQLSVVRLDDPHTNKELLLLEIKTVIEQLAEPPSMKYVTVGSLIRHAQFHNVDQPFFIVDRHRRLLYFNQNGRELTKELHGRPAGLGDPPRAYFLDDTLEEFENHLERALLGEELEVEHVFDALGEHQEHRQAVYRPVHTKDEGVIAVSIALKNIGPRRVAEDRLEQHGQTLWKHFERLPLPLIVIGADLRVQQWNQAFQELLGFEIDRALTGEDIDKFVYPEDQESVREALAQLFSGGLDYFLGEHRYCDDEGIPVWVNHIGFAIDEEVDTERSALLIAVDVTDRKEAELRAEQALRINAVGELAGGVAHDFNNLLTIISNISQLLGMKLTERGDDDLVEDLNRIDQAVERATSLTRQLLTFSLREEIELEVIDLNSHLRGIHELLEGVVGEHIALDIDLAPNLAPVDIGKGQIDQITMNLTVNARDAMPDGGRLRITTSQMRFSSDDSRPRVDLPPGHWVVLEFSDTGVGMNRETRRRLFEPFFTTKGPGKGTGLGLATVYRIVKKIEGRIYVDSKPGEGTTFTIYIPASAREFDTAALDRAEADARTEAGPPCVLLLEDEEDIRKPYRIFLERAGFRILEAPNIEEARALFDEYADQIDLLLADVVLPDGSGVELARELQARLPPLEVIFMSGYAPDLIYSGPDELARKWLFLPKPVSRQKLVSAVRESLASGRAR